MVEFVIGSHIVLLDDADLDLIGSLRWSITNGRSGLRYAVNRVSGTYMHALILPGDLVDHINRNGLDNRRSNLRPAAHWQNSGNTRGRGGTSDYKGVCWHLAAGAWVAQIGHPRRHLGIFDSEIEAARAYDRAAVERWGTYAFLNFSGESTDSQLLHERRTRVRQSTGRGSSSLYKGVYPQPGGAARWCARIQVDGRNLYLGSFGSEVDAAKAYDVAALRFPSGVRERALNFPG